MKHKDLLIFRAIIEEGFPIIIVGDPGVGKTVSVGRFKGKLSVIDTSEDFSTESTLKPSDFDMEFWCGWDVIYVETPPENLNYVRAVNFSYNKGYDFESDDMNLCYPLAIGEGEFIGDYLECLVVSDD